MIRGSRASALLLAPAIPRQVWDPKHYNTKHVDSYAKAIADRRIWPAKKWSVGTEPRVRDDWNHYSLRNLAYQYNAKLRACDTFPDMIPIYAEMKARGAKIDTDTMMVMLSRAARFTNITPSDLFLLYDEMISLGAKPDMAVIEVLHTILDHSVSVVGSSNGSSSGSSAATDSTAWREAKRLQLIEAYDRLCADEVEQLGDRKLSALLGAQVAQYRRNTASLDGRLSLATWKQYIATITSVETLFEEVANFLNDYVPKAMRDEFPRTEMRFSTVASIPHLYRHNALSRPTNRPQINNNNANNNDNNNNNEYDAINAIAYPERMAYRSQFADDLAINEVLLAALERFIDAPLETRLPRSDEPALLLFLEKYIKTTGVLVTADLAAQMMDVCKYATTFATEAAATRIMQMAFHGSAVPTTPYRMHWKLAEVGVDGRVLGRHLAARNPWGNMRFDLGGNGKFGDFKPMEVSGEAATEAEAEAEAEGGAAAADGEGGAKAERGGRKARSGGVSYTGGDVRDRWESVKKAVSDSGALDLEAMVRRQQPIDAAAVMEVYTGQACFLRNMFLEERYPPTEEQLRAAGQLNTDPDAYGKKGAGAAGGASAGGRASNMASRNMTIEACEAIFKALQGLKRSMDIQINEAALMKGAATTLSAANADGIALVPELECWESMLLVSKHMMDFCLAKRDVNGASGRQLADDLFKSIAQFRHGLLEESRDKFDGRFRILWLQEM